jgi:ABC-type sugar transport system substrate-binding protein
VGEGEVNAEWIAEIERRTRAVLAGEPGIPWEEAREEIRKNLKANPPKRKAPPPYEP